MSVKEKLIKRFLTRPKDFTFEELVTLLGYYDYYLNNKGKTSGSRIEFINSKDERIKLHKPHRTKYLLDYQIKNIISVLKAGGFIDEEYNEV